jgi:hypothetical protein
MRFKLCQAAVIAVFGVLIAGMSAERAQAQIDTLPYNALNYSYAPQTYFDVNRGEFGTGAQRDTRRGPYFPAYDYAPRTYYDVNRGEFGTGTPAYPDNLRYGYDTPYTAGYSYQYPYYGGYYYGAYPEISYTYGGPLLYGRFGNTGRVGYRFGWW